MSRYPLAQGGLELDRVTEGGAAPVERQGGLDGLGDLARRGGVLARARAGQAQSMASCRIVLGIGMDITVMGIYIVLRSRPHSQSRGSPGTRHARLVRLMRWAFQDATGLSILLAGPIGLNIGG
ncbi:hypothetical protein MKK58_18295 [Methylobacterium sp. J-078]|uniref:hypothetical protein n=1 Tax=Methylobacterium sp. J-078 TaxID=2836657 RepID=UPI001FBA0594|nr:hypothetical protein [Methylobacterium sp. J-078]MCJ2046469.1 hypothetical protein [Methylobacterium sp. J-078]